MPKVVVLQWNVFFAAFPRRQERFDVFEEPRLIPPADAVHVLLYISEISTRHVGLAWFLQALKASFRTIFFKTLSTYTSFLWKKKYIFRECRVL